MLLARVLVLNICSYRLGGDHTIVLPILRALHKIYGPISVIHFDAHLDTWPAYPGTSTDQSRITHGTFFYLAKEEGLMSNHSVHAGIRCKLAVGSSVKCQFVTVLNCRKRTRVLRTWKMTRRSASS